MSAERRPGQLVLHLGDVGDGHEAATHRTLGGRLAGLLGLETADVADPDNPRTYHVPRRTLVGSDEAERLGIRSADDLFGGWVPHDWMATKAIAHPLVDSAAVRPEGWTNALAEHAGDLVLAGYSAFCRKDAERAGAALLDNGFIRLKPVHADGARGQIVVRNREELEAALRDLGGSGHLGDALVLEENLEEVRTFSVGSAEVGGRMIAYCGTQSLTTDNRGGRLWRLRPHCRPGRLRGARPMRPQRGTAGGRCLRQAFRWARRRAPARLHRIASQL